MGSFADSWQITKTSLRLIREDPAMLALPVLSGLSLLAVIALLAVPWVVLDLTNPSSFSSLTSQGAGQALLAVCALAAYFVCVFLANLFAAALVWMATNRLDGGRPTVRQALGFARQKWVRILVWSLVAGTVGLVIRALERRLGFIGGLIVGAIAGATWAITTYFIIPVVVFESGGMVTSFKRSATLFLQTFGRTILSNLYAVLIGVGLFVLGLVVVIGGFVVGFSTGSFALGAALVLVGLAIWVFAAVLMSALEGILRAALYRYATTGRIAPGLVPSEYQRGMGIMPPPPPPPPPPPVIPSPPLPSGPTL